MIVVPLSGIQNPAYRLAAFLHPPPKGSLNAQAFMKRKMHAGAGKEIYQRARELRNRSTHPEDVLWGYLKTKPHGFKLEDNILIPFLFLTFIAVH